MGDNRQEKKRMGNVLGFAQFVKADRPMQLSSADQNHFDATVISVASHLVIDSAGVLDRQFVCEGFFLI
ncbi:hypothetical protein KIN20_001951 [Parelaphostrongylus tenuis]|uniref:Uncharacterized protein n=1 Tax=Parelaphostrongylus tenuis TaxID=148309 RepID=A0AAD5MFW5_PARTN|nr:hypothetical protein KIN20_001951 [Parelaphostrongylus tenuis]